MESVGKLDGSWSSALAVVGSEDLGENMGVFRHIPLDIIKEIFGFLEELSLGRSQRVCKLFRIIALDEKYWKPHFENLPGKVLRLSRNVREAVACQRLLERQIQFGRPKLVSFTSLHHPNFVGDVAHPHPDTVWTSDRHDTLMLGDNLCIYNGNIIIPDPAAKQVRMVQEQTGAHSRLDLSVKITEPKCVVEEIYTYATAGYLVAAYRVNNETIIDIWDLSDKTSKPRALHFENAITRNRFVIDNDELFFAVNHLSNPLEAGLYCCQLSLAGALIAKPVFLGRAVDCFDVSEHRVFVATLDGYTALIDRGGDIIWRQGPSGKTMDCQFVGKELFCVDYCGELRVVSDRVKNPMSPTIRGIFGKGVYQRTFLNAVGPYIVIGTGERIVIICRDGRRRPHLSSPVTSWKRSIFTRCLLNLQENQEDIPPKVQFALDGHGRPHLYVISGCHLHKFEFQRPHALVVAVSAYTAPMWRKADKFIHLSVLPITSRAIRIPGEALRYGTKPIFDGIEYTVKKIDSIGKYFKFW